MKHSFDKRACKNLLPLVATIQDTEGSRERMIDLLNCAGYVMRLSEFIVATYQELSIANDEHRLNQLYDDWHMRNDGAEFWIVYETGSHYWNDYRLTIVEPLDPCINTGDEPLYQGNMRAFTEEFGDSISLEWDSLPQRYKGHWKGIEILTESGQLRQEWQEWHYEDYRAHMDGYPVLNDRASEIMYEIEEEARIEEISYTLRYDLDYDLTLSEAEDFAGEIVCWDDGYSTDADSVEKTIREYHLIPYEGYCCKACLSTDDLYPDGLCMECHEILDMYQQYGKRRFASDLWNPPFDQKLSKAVKALANDIQVARREIKDTHNA